jgi:hypothetical protein
VQSTDDLFIYLEGGGAEGEKKMCGIVTGFWYSSRSIKVHEREVRIVTGPYCYGGLFIRGGYCSRSATVSGRVLFIPGYCSHDPVLFLKQCYVTGECLSTVF